MNRHKRTIRDREPPSFRTRALPVYRAGLPCGRQSRPALRAPEALNDEWIHCVRVSFRGVSRAVAGFDGPHGACSNVLLAHAAVAQMAVAAPER